MAKYVRLNIYLDDPAVRDKVRAAATARGMTISEYCLMAIKAQLERDPAADERALERRRKAAEAIDRLRRKIGPIGIPVSALVREGRRR